MSNSYGSTNYKRTSTDPSDEISAEEPNENLNQIVVVRKTDKEKMRETYFTDQIIIPDDNDVSQSLLF